MATSAAAPVQAAEFDHTHAGLTAVYESALNDGLVDEAGARLPEVNVIVLTLVSGATISGRVEPADGEAVAGAQVLCPAPDGRGGSTTSGVDGTFVARGLDEGEFELLEFVSQQVPGGQRFDASITPRYALLHGGAQLPVRNMLPITTPLAAR